MLLCEPAKDRDIIMQPISKHASIFSSWSNNYKEQGLPLPAIGCCLIFYAKRQGVCASSLILRTKPVCLRLSNVSSCNIMRFMSCATLLWKYWILESIHMAKHTRNNRLKLISTTYSLFKASTGRGQPSCTSARSDPMYATSETINIYTHMN